ncbi:MAG: SBBP repeat-containing protein [Bdellovibrionota bacterium]
MRVTTHPAVPAPVSVATIQANAARTFAGQVLPFEENVGQRDASVRFTARGNGFIFELHDDAITLLSCNQNDESHPHPITLSFPGSRHLAGEARGESELTSHVNFFTGTDRSQWKTNVRQFAKVTYPSLYPGIDAVFYGPRLSQFEFDLNVDPGSDPSLIRLKYDGAQQVRVSDRGSLLIDSDCGSIEQHPPKAYQMIRGERRQIRSSYSIVARNEVRIELGAYDPSLPLVIDPVIATSSFIGGSSLDNLTPIDIAVDDAGNAYLTGSTYSTDFPARSKAFQKKNAGNLDVFVVKVIDSGTKLLFTSYLGGKELDEGIRIAAGPLGSVLVSGTTHSKGFPTTKSAVQDKMLGEVDGFLAKLSPKGDVLEYSTFLGGDDPAPGPGYISHDSVNGLAVDFAGNMYAAFPTRANTMPHLSSPNPISAKNACTGCFTAYLVKLDPTGKLVYGTFIGSQVSTIDGVEADKAGNAYVLGSLSGHVFVTKVDSTGSSRIFNMDLGGKSSEWGHGIAVDSDGQAYVTGTTNSPDFPVTAGAFQTVARGNGDGFVTKLKADGTGIVYSTFLGGSRTDVAYDVALDSDGAVYVVGYSDSADFPHVRAFQDAAGGRDGFIAKLSPLGDKLLYSSLLGGSGDDVASGIAVSKKKVFIAGWTESENFPVKNPFQATLAGGSDAFLVRLGDPGMYLR